MQLFIYFPYLTKTSVFCYFVSYGSVKAGNFVTFLAQVNFYFENALNIKRYCPAIQVWGRD
jgi:hypothetical protein